MIRHPWLLTLLIAISPLASNAAASGTMSAEKMWSLTRLGDTDISPDGRLAVVSVTRFDIKKNKGFTDLWLVATDGSGARPLTSDPAPDSAPTFSPDGRSVAFVSKRDDDKTPQIYRIAIDGGEAQRVTQLPTGADAPKWFPDGRRIAFVSSIWPDLVRWEDQAVRLEERAESKVSARVWDKAPIAYWDRYLDDTEPHLFSVDVADGSLIAITRLSGFHLSKSEYSASSYDISPDGLEIAFAANTDKSGVAPNYDLITLEACGCKPAVNRTADNAADEGSPAYSPDGRWLAWSAQSIPGFYADRARLMLLDRASGVARSLSGDWDRSVGEIIWRGDSKAAYSAVDDAATHRIYRFDLNAPGKPVAITASSSFGALAVARRGGAKPLAVALRQSFTEPPTLVRLDLAKQLLPKRKSALCSRQAADQVDDGHSLLER